MIDKGAQGHHQYHHQDPYQQQQKQQGCRKGPWTPEEDKFLTEYVTSHGEGRWSSVSKCAGLNRSGKSCRLRWVNYLRPGLKRGQITPQEEGIILELHSLWGNKWSTIARYLPGRTDNEIKNYWRTHYNKKGNSCLRQEKVKRSQYRKQKQDLKPKPQPHNLASQLGSQDHMKLDNEQNIASSSFNHARVFNDQFHKPQNVAATSSDHFMIDESHLWGSMWNLDDNDPHGFSEGSRPIQGDAIADKFNGGGIETPSCGSADYSYSGFYTGGFIF